MVHPLLQSQTHSAPSRCTPLSVTILKKHICATFAPCMAAVLQGVEEPSATKLARLGISAEQGSVPQRVSAGTVLVLSSCYAVATLHCRLQVHVR
jgi:hypothetical protein